MLRPAELDFLVGLRAGLLAIAFLAVALREDFFVAGFLAAAALTDRFRLPLAAAFLGFLTTFAVFVAKEATALPAAWAPSCKESPSLRPGVASRFSTGNLSTRSAAPETHPP